MSKPLVVGNVVAAVPGISSPRPLAGPTAAPTAAATAPNPPRQNLTSARITSPLQLAAPGDPSSRTSKVTRIVITGLPKGFTAPFSSGGAADAAGTKQADGRYDRGIIQIEDVKQTQRGLIFTVMSGHSVPADRLALYFQVKVRAAVKDPATGVTREEDRTYFLSVLTGQQEREGYQPEIVANPSVGNMPVYEARQTFEVCYADVEAYLKRALPKANLKVDASTPFAVLAKFGGSHEWGGFHRMGVVSGADAVNKTGEVPFSVSLAYPDALRESFPVLDVPGGTFESHIEAEVKTRVPLSRFDEVYQRYMALAFPKTDAERIAAALVLGNEWEVEASSYFVPKHKDKTLTENNLQRDADGRFKVKQFADRYFDNAKSQFDPSQAADLAKNRIAFRIRAVEGDKEGVAYVGFKPGSGAVDPATNIARRLETTQQVRASVFRDPDQLYALFNASTEQFNPFRNAQARVPGLRSSLWGETSVLQPSMELQARRYKLVFHHGKRNPDGTFTRDGLEVEGSLDDVTGMRLDSHGRLLRLDDKGVPSPKGTHFGVARFGQFEMELEHGAFAPGAASGATSQAFAVSAGANSVSTDEDTQLAWGRTVEHGTLIGPPRVHSLSDIDDPKVGTKAGYDAYAAFCATLQTHLFGQMGSEAGAHPTAQKNSIASRLAGIVKPDPAEQRLYDEEQKISALFQRFFAPVADAIERRVDGLLKTAQAAYDKAHDKLGLEARNAASKLQDAARAQMDALTSEAQKQSDALNAAAAALPQAQKDAAASKAADLQRLARSKGSEIWDAARKASRALERAAEDKAYLILARADAEVSKLHVEAVRQAKVEMTRWLDGQRRLPEAKRDPAARELLTVLARHGVPAH